MGALEKYYGQLRASGESAPSFLEVRLAREKAKTLDEQRRLALEDRRAFAREYVQDKPFIGPFSMMVLPPLEQVYKGVQHMRGREVGRSGFFDPLANIGAAYQGTIEGMAMGKRGKK